MRSLGKNFMKISSALWSACASLLIFVNPMALANEIDSGLRSNQSTPCPQIDPDQRFSDNIAMCPNEVRRNSVWSVLRCSYNQSTTLKNVRSEDKSNLKGLFNAIQTHVNTSREIDNFSHNPYAGNADTILDKSEALGLQVCRSTDTSKNDSFLLFYSKPGVTDNTGAFFGVRETKSSRIVILLPHDDSDGYAATGKQGFSESKAFGFMSNSNSRKPFGGRVNDWSHETSNWGYSFFQEFNRLSVNEIGNKPFFINMHGMADTSRFLSYSGPRRPLSLEAFNTAVSEVYPGLERKAFTVHYAVRSAIPCSSDRYIQTEIPAARHRHGKSVLNIVRKLEMDSPENSGQPRFPVIWSNPNDTNSNTNCQAP